MAWKTIYKGNSEDEAGAAVINALKRATPQLQQGVVKSGYNSTQEVMKALFRGKIGRDTAVKEVKRL